MDELRFVRREDQSLIVVNDADEEFRFVVDEAALLELRHLAKRERESARVSPREIQALIRAGRSRAQVAAETGLDEADVERYEEPVLAERRYILERAHAVPVRTDAHDEADQRFGAVIAERLISLGADASEWSSWRDAETGWMVSLEFISHDVAHRAVWSFEHRKGTLSPVNPDAVNLSKQGDVGDRLIPKLRAVDDGEKSGRFDSGAFDTGAIDPDQLQFDVDGGDSSDARDDAGDEDRDGHSPSLADADAEYARRREIDQRAIKSDEGPVDLSQTADLLDALRRRRGERELANRASDHEPAADAPRPSDRSDGSAVPPDSDGGGSRSPHDAAQDAPVQPRSKGRSIWAGAAVSKADRQEARGAQPVDLAAVRSGADRQSSERPDAPRGAAFGAGAADRETTQQSSGRTEAEGRKKGRASIPSWDDILFGTRSDEDPAER